MGAFNTNLSTVQLHRLYALSPVRNMGFEWRDTESGSRSTEPTGRFFDLLELITPQIDLRECVAI